jgi:hypothetical protein
MIPMTTSGLNQFFYGLEDIFGPDVPIDLEFKVIRAFAFDSSKAKSMAYLTFDMNLTLLVRYSNGTKVNAGNFEFDHTDCDFSIKIKNMKAYANVKDLAVHKIFINSKYLDDKRLDISIMTTFFNAAFAFGLFFLNRYLE